MPLDHRVKSYRVAKVVGVEGEGRGGIESNFVPINFLRKQGRRGKSCLNVSLAGGTLVAVVRGVGDLESHT